MRFRRYNVTLRRVTDRSGGCYALSSLLLLCALYVSFDGCGLVAMSIICEKLRTAWRSCSSMRSALGSNAGLFKSMIGAVASSLHKLAFSPSLIFLS